MAPGLLKTLLSLVQSVLGAIALILHDDRGVSAAIVAIALPSLIGLGALGVETGAWFTTKLRNQSAADAAAISAAYEVLAGKTNVINDLAPAAGEAAARNSYNGTAPVVDYPYSDAIVVNGVAVTLQQTQEPMLAGMFLSGVTVANKAVAVIEVLDYPCILALGTTNTGVELAASTSLFMPNCSIVANSVSGTAIELLSSSSSITAATLVTAGEIAVQGNPIDPAAPPPEFSLGSLAEIGAPTVADPYAGTLTHSYIEAGMPTSRCKPTKSGSVTVYKTGNCIISGLNIATGYTADLAPGTYWVTGNLVVQSNGRLECSICDPVKGTGVTIILTSQTSKIGYVSMSNATFELNAPSSGRFAGVVMVQDANGLPYTRSYNTVTGAPGATLNGLVYFPKTSMTFHGNPSTTGPKCLLLVVSSLNVDANSSLDIGGCENTGLVNVPKIYTVALAE
jgi:Flp pilus assembly protein TadG